MLEAGLVSSRIFYIPVSFGDTNVTHFVCFKEGGYSATN